MRRGSRYARAKFATASDFLPVSGHHRGETAIRNSTAVTAPEDPLLDLAVSSLEDDKAEDIVVIPLAGRSTIGDYMVIASGQSSRQLSAMAEHLIFRLKRTPLGRVSVEGLAQGDWVLIDAGDVIIHLFRPEVRAFYGLEKMWSIRSPEPVAEAETDSAGPEATD